MYWIYGLFQPSLTLELGIKKLQQKGFSGDKLKLITLEPTLPTKQRLFDSMYQTDGASLVDGIAMASSVGMLLGVIYGSLSSIGSIAMGLIGLFAGGFLGFFVDMLISKRRDVKASKASGEIIISVLCQNEDQQELVKSIFKEFRAVAISEKIFLDI